MNPTPNTKVASIGILDPASVSILDPASISILDSTSVSVLDLAFVSVLDLAFEGSRFMSMIWDFWTTLSKSFVDTERSAHNPHLEQPALNQDLATRDSGSSDIESGCRLTAHNPDPEANDLFFVQIWRYA